MYILNTSVFLYIYIFFNDTATTEIYTLSLHDALPISVESSPQAATASARQRATAEGTAVRGRRLTRERIELLLRRRSSDRKSTRLNSSHANISYAVFCLKKKKKKHVS